MYKKWIQFLELLEILSYQDTFLELLLNFWVIKARYDKIIMVTKVDQLPRTFFKLRTFFQKCKYCSLWNCFSNWENLFKIDKYFSNQNLFLKLKNDLILKFLKGSVLENLPKLMHSRDTFLKLAQTENKSFLVPSYSHEKLSVHQLQSVEWLADYSNVLVS